MLDLWRSAQKGRKEGELALPKRIKYRNTKPVYVGSWYRVGMGEESAEGVAELKVLDESGAPCVVGSVEGWRA
jgi:hypothetical protein